MKDLIEALNRAHQLDKSVKLHEAASVTVDTVGLQKNLPVVIKELLSQLPYKLQYQKLTGQLEKNTRPVSYTFRGTAHVIKDDSVHDTWKFRDKDGVTGIDFTLYNLPVNCELTTELLKTTYEKTILEAITYCFTSADDFESRGALYQSLEQRLKDGVRPLETKYRVTLNAYFYPPKEDFQRRSESLFDVVRITSVEGKLGQLQKQDSGYYEYVVDGKSYSSFLRYYEHNVSPSKYTVAEKIDIDWIVAETEERIINLLSKIDELDNILKNESIAEKNMAEFITSLAHKYPDAELTATRKDTWYALPPFVVSYNNGSDSWEIYVGIDEVVASFEKVKKRIQQKIYRTRRTQPQSSYAPTDIELKFESTDVFEELNKAHELDESTNSVRVPAAIRDYVDTYCDAINDLPSYNEDKWDRGTGGEFFDSGKCSSAYADRVMYGVMDNYELNDNQLDAVYKYVEFQEEPEWYDDSSVTNVFDASCLQDNDDEYDDDFEEGLLGTAIQAAKNLNPLNLFEGEGADTTRAIVDILDKTSAEDKPTWVKAVKDVVDVIPDEYMDNLFDIAKEKLSDVQVSDEDKTKIVDAAGVPVEGAQEANTVGKILSLFDITEWDPKTLKTYIVSVLAIVALIEPTPILEIITGIITLLPPEAVKAILTVTNMIGNPVGAAATLVNRAMKSRGSDDLEESFNVGDRVKQTWANPYNVGEVIDTKYDPEKGNLVQVKWDYSDDPEIEWLNYEDVSPYNEEDEKAGYYEGLFDKPKKNRHTDEDGNPVLTKLDPPPEGFFDDEAPKLYKAEPAKHKRRHSIFGNKKKPTPAGDPLDDLFDDEF